MIDLPFISRPTWSHEVAYSGTVGGGMHLTTRQIPRVRDSELSVRPSGNIRCSFFVFNQRWSGPKERLWNRRSTGRWVKPPHQLKSRVGAAWPPLCRENMTTHLSVRLGIPFTILQYHNLSKLNIFSTYSKLVTCNG